tara:strand:- start:1268 stop:2083 length:816 start_codon:yes stop_codon:yes gene_type:complete
MSIKKNSITVGIPFYKKTNAEYFDIAIKSIINQTVSADKIHLIQDGDIDGVLIKIITKYQKKYPNIKLIKLPKKGLPYALNQSIKQSYTEYYARMDADDISLKNRFESQMSYFQKNINLEILGSWVYEFEQDYQKEPLFINKTPIKKNTIESYVHYRNPLVHPSVMFKMSVFDKIGYYNEEMYTDQDLELWGRALKHGINISNIQEPLLFLRTEGRLIRRSKFSAIKRQVKIRYSYNTCSFKLNLLKLASIILRILPNSISNWCYQNLRNL